MPAYHNDQSMFNIRTTTFFKQPCPPNSRTIIELFHCGFGTRVRGFADPVAEDVMVNTPRYFSSWYALHIDTGTLKQLYSDYFEVFFLFHRPFFNHSDKAVLPHAFLYPSYFFQRCPRCSRVACRHPSQKLSVLTTSFLLCPQRATEHFHATGHFIGGRNISVYRECILGRVAEIILHKVGKKYPIICEHEINTSHCQSLNGIMYLGSLTATASVAAKDCAKK